MEEAASENFSSGNSEQDEQAKKETELKSLFRKSLKFSQGDITTQTMIFRWLNQNNYLDSFDIPATPPANISEIVPPGVHKHTPEIEIKIKETIDSAWEALYKITSGQDKEIVSSSELLGSIVGRDFYFQQVPREGRIADIDVLPDSLHDPHASFLRKYCLNRESTGSDVFNSLFSTIRAPLVTALTEDVFGSQNPNLTSSIHMLRNSWEDNHKVLSKLLDPDYTQPTFYAPDTKAA